MDNSEKLFQAGMSCIQSNPDEAARLFGEAVKDNHLPAMFYLAQLNYKKDGLFSGAKIETAVKLFTTLAKEHGEPQAKFELGAMLCYGKRVEWNPEEGSKWINEFEDDIRGIDNVPFYFYSTLGDLYCKGRLRRSDDPINNVTVEDLKKAIEYLEKAIQVADDSSDPACLSETIAKLALQKERLQLEQNAIEDEERLKRWASGR